MEFHLRCNALKCRIMLTEKAVVTTCCHIFCVDCANNLNLAAADLRERRCPACKVLLPNPDDAVATVLTPTEDYKTSVLSGLDPNTIMECAGRALVFWTYQTTQEIFYQQLLGKSLTEKYGHLSSQMDKIVQEANTEIETCQKQIEALQLTNKKLDDEKKDILKQYQAKASKHAQTQKMYDQLKSRYCMPGVSAAALESANLIAPSRPGTYNSKTRTPLENHDHPMENSRFPLPRSNLHVNGMERINNSHRDASGSGSVHSGDYLAMPPPQRPDQGHRSHNVFVSTPQHRSQLPGPLRGTTAQAPTPEIKPYFHAPGLARQSPHKLSASRRSQGSSGYGISAGMKVGRASSDPHFTGQTNGHPTEFTSDLANGLGGAFATGPAYPGNRFS